MNGTKTPWQRLACSAEETHDEESQEWNISLKKLLEIKQQQQMWTHIQQLLQLCTIMYSAHMSSGSRWGLSTVMISIYSLILFSLIYFDKFIWHLFHLYSFLFRLSSLCVCRLAKPGCDSKRHYRGEITASQLDWHTLHQNICLIHFYITFFFFLNFLHVSWTFRVGLDFTSTHNSEDIILSYRFCCKMFHLHYFVFNWKFPSKW